MTHPPLRGRPGRTLAGLFLFLALALTARGAHVAFNLADFALANLTNRVVHLTPQSTPRTNTGALVVTSDRRRYWTDTNGTFTASNLVYGVYRVDVFGAFTTTTFNILVPESSSLLSAYTLLTTTNTVAAATVGFTQVQSDSRYVLRTNGWATNLLALDLVATNSLNLKLGTVTTRPGLHLFGQTNLFGVSVSNTNAATAITGTGLGSPTIPALWPAPGRGLRFIAAGDITTPGTPEQLTMNLKLGAQDGTILQMVPPANLDGYAWQATGTLTWVATNTIRLSSHVMIATTVAQLAPPTNRVHFVNMGYDHTTNTPVAITVRWTSNGVGSMMNCNLFHVELLP